MKPVDRYLQDKEALEDGLKSEGVGGLRETADGRACLVVRCHNCKGVGSTYEPTPSNPVEPTEVTSEPCPWCRGEGWISEEG